MGRSEVRGTVREREVMEDSSQNKHSQAVLVLEAFTLSEVGAPWRSLTKDII